MGTLESTVWHAECRLFDVQQNVQERAEEEKEAEEFLRAAFQLSRPSGGPSRALIQPSPGGVDPTWASFVRSGFFSHPEI
jgi:hypothetical protein